MNIQTFVRDGNRAALPLLYAILDAPETFFIASDADNESVCFERAYSTFDRYDGYIVLCGNFLSGNTVSLFYGIKNEKLLV